MPIFTTTVISIHALLAESDHAPSRHPCPHSNFYPRSPCGERPRQVKQTYRAEISISIHALLAESDVAGRPNGAPCGHFYPRSPCGERPGLNIRQIQKIEFLSTLSLRRATKVYGYGDNKKIISIHALLAESDSFAQNYYYSRRGFLSTLSLRRATNTRSQPSRPKAHFYPRSPCGERRGSGVGSWPRVIFLSTLSLRRATARQLLGILSITFLSTLSLRRATSLWVVLVRRFHDFYPRSPCGERQYTHLWPVLLD